MSEKKKSKIPLYQHPFIDIFKVFQVLDWKNSLKTGEVTECIDKTINKQVLTLKGATNTSIQIPNNKSNSLGLTGKFIYIECIGNTNKRFSIYFDYLIDEKQVTRLSLSNIFKLSQVLSLE